MMVSEEYCQSKFLLANQQTRTMSDSRAGAQIKLGTGQMPPKTQYDMGVTIFDHLQIKPS